MAKFTTKDLQDIKAWQKQIKPYFKKFERLNTTAKYWNTKGHMAVLNNHAYEVEDLIDFLQKYLIPFKTAKRKYSENQFGLAEKATKARPGTKPVRRKATVQKSGVLPTRLKTKLKNKR